MVAPTEGLLAVLSQWAVAALEGLGCPDLRFGILDLGRSQTFFTAPERSYHLETTVWVAEPPRLLRTVMFCGLLGHVKRPSYLPPPLLVSVPINWLVEVT